MFVPVHTLSVGHRVGQADALLLVLQVLLLRQVDAALQFTIMLPLRGEGLRGHVGERSLSGIQIRAK